MSRYLKPYYALALLGLATFGMAPVLAQDEFRPDPPRAAIEDAKAPVGDLSTVVVPSPRTATTTRPPVVVRRSPANSVTTVLRPTTAVDPDPAATTVTTDPVIGPAQQRTRIIPRITRYNPRLVPGVRELRAATVRQADEEVATPGIRVLPLRSHLIGSEQSGPYHRDRYLFYERDRRFNPSPYPGGGGGYNLVH